MITFLCKNHTKFIFSALFLIHTTVTSYATIVEKEISIDDSLFPKKINLQFRTLHAEQILKYKKLGHKTKKNKLVIFGQHYIPVLTGQLKNFSIEDTYTNSQTSNDEGLSTEQNHSRFSPAEQNLGFIDYTLKTFASTAQNSTALRTIYFNSQQLRGSLENKAPTIFSKNIPSQKFNDNFSITQISQDDINLANQQTRRKLPQIRQVSSSGPQSSFFDDLKRNSTTIFIILTIMALLLYFTWRGIRKYM